MNAAAPVIVLSGAGGGTPELAPFQAGCSEATRFEILAYPGWRRYVEPDFSLDSWLEDLALQIERMIPNGPIRMIGISIGAHLGYAVAVRLQAAGREISGFCAIDAFMINSAAPSPGWLVRALALGSRFIRERRLVDFAEFVRSRFWRAVLLLSQDRLVRILRNAKQTGWLEQVVAADPVLEHELSMRLLLQTVAPGIAALDCKPIALNTLSVLLRTELSAASDAGWRRRCPGIKIRQIPGNHATMLEPQHCSAVTDAFSAATRDWRLD